MPAYSFKCGCGIKQETLSINEYLTRKNEVCQVCNKKFKTMIPSFFSNIDKSSDELKDEIKRDVKEIVQKIKEGDQQTLIDIYGDDENPYF